VAVQLVTLITGGMETLPKILAGGLLELDRARDQRKALATDPALCAGAFEEMIRHQGVLQHVGRTALRDVDVAGQRIRRGERVFLLLQSANRDEREFPEPDRFDAARRPARHLGFGQGVHHCVGIHLARLEGRVLLEELLRALPEHTVDARGAERAVSEFQIGYTRMPVEFDAR
jgi:cytochrome P450